MNVSPIKVERGTKLLDFWFEYLFEFGSTISQVKFKLHFMFYNIQIR